MLHISLDKTLAKKFALIHWHAVAVITLIACFGFIMMISAAGGDAGQWALPQIIKFTVAFTLMLGIAIMPADTLLRHAYSFYILCLFILLTVEIVGYMGKGAQRWVDLGFFNLQPSELMKVALILALARYFHNLHPEDVSKPRCMMPPLLMTLIPAIFILRQPNLGTTAILVGVAAVLFFMAGLKLRYFAMVAVAAVATAPVGWHFLHDYQKQRVMTFLDPGQDPLGSGYNILQSVIAIGSGGFSGKGYMQGSQGQLNFLPEKHTDFIFTMVGEEFGFLGSVLLIVAYALLLFYGVMIGLRSRSTFGALLAMGVVALLFLHLLINMAMVMALVPVVGVPLPLMSYGGTIMMTILLAFGLMLNAHVHRDVQVHREAF